MRMAVHNNGGHIVFKIPNVSVDYVHINSVIEGYIILELPKGVSDFHIFAILAKNLPAVCFGDGINDVYIDIIIGFIVVPACSSGPAKRNCLYLRQLFQFFK